MKCNSKTMLAVGAALGLAAVISYFAFPAARSFIWVNSPLLVALICPVSMLVMMWVMRGRRDQDKTPTGDKQGVAPIMGAGPDNA